MWFLNECMAICLCKYNRGLNIGLFFRGVARIGIGLAWACVQPWVEFCAPFSFFPLVAFAPARRGSIFFESGANHSSDC